jgi:bis(5'-nucleosidyl)-tetraphosphatase
MKPTKIDNSWYERPTHVRAETSAGGVVARLENDRVLIAAVREGRLPDYILPKGRLEAGESIEVAAYREVAEEAGLTDLVLVANLGQRERLDYSKKRWKIIHYFLFFTQQIDGTPTDTTHAYELHWFDLDRLPHFFWPEQQALLESHRTLIETTIRDRAATIDH